MKKFPPVKALILLTFLTGLLASCSKSNSDNGPKNTTPNLAISELSVNSGPYTTSVTITGVGFSSTAANDKVFFNGVAAVVASAASTEIRTTVPLAAGTGPVTITVNGNTAAGPTFTYVQAQVVSTFVGVGSPAGTGITTGIFRPDGIVTDATGNVYNC